MPRHPVYSKSSSKMNMWLSVNTMRQLKTTTSNRSFQTHVCFSDSEEWVGTNQCRFLVASSYTRLCIYFNWSSDTCCWGKRNGGSCIVCIFTRSTRMQVQRRFPGGKRKGRGKVILLIGHADPALSLLLPFSLCLFFFTCRNARYRVPRKRT